MGYRDVIATMMERVKNTDPARIQGMNSIYQFELKGDDCRPFHIKVADGKSVLIEEPAENPDVTMIMDVTDYEEMISGKVSTTSAFMSGKLKVKGDLSLLLNLSTFVQI